MSAAIVPIAPGIFVSGQIALAEVQPLFDQGVRVVVNHRPDNEEPGQIASAALEQAAVALGIRYVHAPVSGLPSPAAVEATAAALDGLEPDAVALLFCRSGMRSSAAWAMADRSRGADAESLRESAAAAGYDLSRLPL
ncbi:TIGR01244 family sulfur transferase [soil metagenome]